VAGSAVRVKAPGIGVLARSGAGCNGDGDGVSGALSWGTTQSWQSGTGDRLGVCPEEVGMLVEDRNTTDVGDVSDEVDDVDVDVDELLVEEVSIDGMCGVY
jgi:mycofactocin precursor